MWALATVALSTRLVAYLFTQNVYGDAFVRIELGERWVAHPHWISAFGDGAYQFGPLHLYALGLASKLFPREHAGRLVSLAAGVATVFPLHALVKRLADARAAGTACLILACWGLHIQFSTTAASEALSLLLFTGALAWFAAERFALAGVALTLACATRYDVWLLIPVLALAIALRRRFAAAVVFSALALAFPVVWMIGNYRMHGDALYPTHYIDEFHRAWYADNEKSWGVVKHRLLCFGFWPLVALGTLTPAIALAGAVYARVHRWLIAVMVVPMVVFTVRSTVLGDFEPLARFTATSLLVLIVYASTAVRRRAVALLAAFTVGLGVYTWHRDVGWADAMRPVSPVTTQPKAVRDACEKARSCRGVPVIASDPGFRDYAVAFYSGVPVKLERNGETGDCRIHF